MTDVKALADLTTHEVEVLHILNGEDVPGWSWGACMAECLSALKGRGLAAGLYHITDAGRAALARRQKEAPDAQ